MKSATGVSVDDDKVQNLNDLLEPIRKSSSLPSIAAAVVIGDSVHAAGAVGVRKLGNDGTPVLLTDQYHLGSCTKTLTATLTAVLIEDGILNWDTTIGSVFNMEHGVGVDVHPDFANVKIEELLTHTGGFATACPNDIWKEAWKNQGDMPPAEQRTLFVTALLSKKPDYEPGTKSAYSNQGYAVAGTMLEILTKMPWEGLMQEHIFDPLGLGSAGFRAPGAADSEATPVEPWGHKPSYWWWRPAIPVSPNDAHSDNPDAIGPAGTVHMSIQDWAKFARVHLLQDPDGIILHNPESFAKLNSTLPNSGKLGVGGWVVQDMPALGGHCLQMTGSNTMWFALFWVFPSLDKAIVVTTNSGQKNAFESLDAVVTGILREATGNESQQE